MVCCTGATPILIVESFHIVDNTPLTKKLRTALYIFFGRNTIHDMLHVASSAIYIDLTHCGYCYCYMLITCAEYQHLY